MAMAIDKSGQECLTVQIKYSRFTAPVPGQFLGATHGQDQTILDGHCLGAGGFVVDGNNRAAKIKRIGRFLCGYGTDQHSKQASCEYTLAK